MGMVSMEKLILLSILIVCHLVPALGKSTFSQGIKEQGSNDRPQTVDSEATSCGYDSCNLGIPGMINVHLVPHTHDDVGWLKTVDQYYYGARSNIQRAGVQYILDSVIKQLLNDPKKRFIYVEIAFFWRWWNQQDDVLRHQVKGLVNAGRLEFILGGWCMNDEATTHYTAIIDQHTLGFKFLKTNFGDCAIPRTAWQIDPFGHSKEQASLFAQMGYDSLYFGRLDYQEKDARKKQKTLEMMWRGSDDLGSAGDLFTGVLYNGYGPPKGFCFDINCNDDPIMDDDRMEDYNVDSKVKAFLKAATEQASAYHAGHIMMTMGSDFNYQDAHVWYKNLDKLIHYVNAKQADGSKVNVFYSTPSCYTLAKNKASLNWTSKSDDFFPYADSPHSFWTGYFTSRSSLKYYTRVVNGFFQAIKQMDVLAELGPLHDSDKKLDALRRAMGVLQHHDAVSGTEKQEVAYDYAQRLGRGIYEAEEVVQDVYNRLMPHKNSSKVPPMMFCSLLNISMCAVTENSKQFTLTLYNPVGRPLSHWVRLPVVKTSYVVFSPDGTKIQSQIVPISSSTFEIPERKGSIAQNELVFRVNLPALGFSTFFVAASPSSMLPRKKTSPVNGPVKLKNEQLSLLFGDDGMLKEMTNLESKMQMSVSQSLKYYTSYLGDNTYGNRASGAYIFRPVSNKTVDISTSAALSLVQGPLVQEVHQKFSDWASQVFRLYKDEKYAEVEWTIGPIPIKTDIRGKEIISLYDTAVNNGGLFYTDANGRQILKRQVDHRDSWVLNQTEEVSGNYYPINSIIYLRDKLVNNQFMILTDRSQGGGCNSRGGTSNNGNVEVMIQRRVLHDDSLGVGQALNETGSDGRGIIVRGKHYLLLETVEKSARLHRDLALRLFKTPMMSFTNTTMSPSDWAKQFVTNWSGLNKSLPPNVNLLTLEHLHGRTVLLRLEHFYQKNEDKELSQSVTVSLKGLFVPIQITAVSELTLGANQKLSDSKRLHWNFKAEESDVQQKQLKLNKAMDVTLTSMQIRSFELTLQQ